MPDKNTTTCGTYGGYQKHKRLGERACTECLKANTAYRREFRKRPEAARREKLRQVATGRALQRLRDEHPEEFARYYVDELSKGRIPSRATREEAA